MKRPDGVELQWESRGEGPPVAICDNFLSIPQALSGLEEELARDHTVVRYDPRGAGRSTRRGPYDIETDAGDLEALLDAVSDQGMTSGDPAATGVVAIGPANGGALAVLCAARRHDLVRAVIAPVGPPVAATQLEGGLASSRPVLEAIGTQLASDYRGAVRSITVLGNPQASKADHRRRVEEQIDYCPEEAALGRWQAWFHSDTTEEARQLGDRLWILLHPYMPWFPVEMADPLRRLLPQAQVEIVEDGPISRPDITADAVRRITGVDPEKPDHGRVT